MGRKLWTEPPLSLHESKRRIHNYWHHDMTCVHSFWLDFSRCCLTLSTQAERLLNPTNYQSQISLKCINLLTSFCLQLFIVRELLSTSVEYLPRRTTEIPNRVEVDKWLISAIYDKSLKLNDSQWPVIYGTRDRGDVDSHVNDLWNWGRRIFKTASTWSKVSGHRLWANAVPTADGNRFDTPATLEIFFFLWEAIPSSCDLETQVRELITIR